MNSYNGATNNSNNFSLSSQFPLGTKFKSQLQENNPRDYQLDSFFSTTQNRHTYFQNAPKTKGALIAAAKKRQNLRLRARTVLCQHCKNVCGENGKIIREKRTTAALVINKRKFREHCVKKFTLVPKLKRLQENDIRKFNQKKQKNNGNINIQIFDKENCDLLHSKMAENLPLKIKILPDTKTTTKLKASNSKTILNKNPPPASDPSKISSDLPELPTQKPQTVETDVEINMDYWICVVFVILMFTHCVSGNLIMTSVLHLILHLQEHKF